MSRRKEKLRAEVSSFMQQYGRKSQTGQEPNDRHYSRKIEGKIKRMKPEELDELLNGAEPDEGVSARVKRIKHTRPAANGAPQRRGF